MTPTIPKSKYHCLYCMIQNNSMGLVIRKYIGIHYQSGLYRYEYECSECGNAWFLSYRNRLKEESA